MRIQKFHWLTPSLFMASLALLACGEESGTEAVDTPTMSEANTVFELGKCTDERNGESVLVIDENVHYVCRERTWIKENSAPIPEQSSSSLFPFNLSSSNLEPSSSAWEYTNTKCVEGVLIDSRDGQSYKTISWEETKGYTPTRTWMIENLRYNPPDPGYDWSWCHNELEENCKYGRYYTFAAALDSINTGCGYGRKGCDLYSTTIAYDNHYDDVKIQGICPNGWHIPNRWDFRDLIHLKHYKDSCNFFSNIIGNSTGREHEYIKFYTNTKLLWTTSFNPYCGGSVGDVGAIDLDYLMNISRRYDEPPPPECISSRLGIPIRCVKD